VASDGHQAVDLFREQPEAIDAVLLDRTMPKKNGLEVLLEMRQLRPEVPVVLMSGHSQEDIAQRCAGRQLSGFVQKPFTPARLLAAVQQAVKKRTRVSDRTISLGPNCAAGYTSGHHNSRHSRSRPGKPAQVRRQRDNFSNFFSHFLTDPEDLLVGCGCGRFCHQ
jgi:DNA-binding NtrC family response regulator